MSGTYVPAHIRAYWDRVAALGCLITRSPGVNICHCHGPSVRERDPRFIKGKGKKQPYQHMLVAPLAPSLHTLMDNDESRFLALYGWTPAQLVDEVGRRLGCDPWQLARAEFKFCPIRESA